MECQKKRSSGVEITRERGYPNKRVLKKVVIVRRSQLSSSEVVIRRRG